MFSGRLLGAILRPNLTDEIEKLKNVTIRHLLQHSGGFWQDDAQDLQLLTNTEYLNWALETYGPDMNEPATSYLYSNFGFFLLGRVIERITGLEYEDYIQRYVFAPMNITGAFIGGSLPDERRPLEVTLKKCEFKRLANLYTVYLMKGII